MALTHACAPAHGNHQQRGCPVPTPAGVWVLTFQKPGKPRPETPGAFTCSCPSRAPAFCPEVGSPGTGTTASVPPGRRGHPSPGRNTGLRGGSGNTFTEVHPREQRPEVRGHVRGLSCSPQPRKHPKANFFSQVITLLETLTGSFPL